MSLNFEYADRLVLAKDVYNELFDNTESFVNFGYNDDNIHLEIASNIIYLLGAIMNNEYVEIINDSPTHEFLFNTLPTDLKTRVKEFINFID